jgi:lysophospholipase L1-like esterase
MGAISLFSKFAVRQNNPDPDAINLMVVSEGDSISLGYNGRTPFGRIATANWPNSRIYIPAQFGGTLQGLEDRAAHDDTFYNPGNGHNVIVVLIGRNDFESGISTTAFVARLKAYCQARQLVGWTVVVCTLLPSGNQSTHYLAYLAWRNAVNPLIRSDPSFYDAVCDFAADPTMGPDAAGDDLSLYYDTLHPSQLGQNNLAAILNTVFENLFSE